MIRRGAAWRVQLGIVLVLLAAACTLPATNNTPLPLPPDAGETVGSVTQPPPTVHPLSLTPDWTQADTPYRDARDIFSGVCFNYWVQQVNRVYVISTAWEHISFYNEVDESELCRFPVTRNPFDFEQGRILIGAVNIGTGCWAYTEPVELVTDDTIRAVILRIGWDVAGDCDYRLVRPFWVSIPRPPEGYTVAFEFLPLVD